VQLDVLGGNMAGTIVRPWDEDWDQARAAWNLSADQMSPDMGQAINERIDAICKGLEPWSTGSCYFNFADRPTALDAIYAPETLERLRDVKRRYDPDGLISGNHNISLA
jgi:hypothetical protein